MLKKLLVVALSLLAVAAMAQNRILVTPNGDAIPIAPNESAAKVAFQHGLTADGAVSAACPTTVNAGFPTVSENNAFIIANGDVACVRVPIPVTGVIKEIWFRPSNGPVGTDSTCLVRLMKSTLAPGDVGEKATKHLGYYNNTSEIMGRSPFKDDAGADTNWVPGNDAGKDPNGEEIWGLGGAAYTWPDGVVWVKILTADLFNEPAVVKGDAVNIDIRVTPGTSPDPTRLGRIFTNASGSTTLWKYYNRDRSGAGTAGWWSRIEYNMNFYIVIEAQGDLPPTIQTVSTVHHTLSTAAQPVVMTAFDCNAATPADTGVVSAKLQYSTDGTIYTDIAMAFTAGIGWQASIPGQALGTRVTYRCTATDKNANESSPSTARVYRVVDLNLNGYTTNANATYSWIELFGGAGTQIPPGSFFNTADPTDDGTAGPFDIGTGFKGLFGVDTLQYVWVGLNGAITMSKVATDTVLVGSGYTSYDPPSSSIPRNFIGAWWNDLYMSAGGGHGSIWTGTSGTKFIVEYYRIGNFNDPADTLTTFEIILDKADNSITVQWENVGSTTLPTDGMTILQLANSASRYLFVDRFGYPTETMAANGKAIKMTYTPSAVGETGEVPKVFALYNNYPNPFNPSTEISFSIPTASQVKLSVYNLLGQEVATLVNEYKNAGSYTVPFSARDLASGVYFYSIKAGNFSDVKKMVLMK